MIDATHGPDLIVTIDLIVEKMTFMIVKIVNKMIMFIFIYPFPLLYLYYTTARGESQVNVVF